MIMSLVTRRKLLGLFMGTTTAALAMDHNPTKPVLPLLAEPVEEDARLRSIKYVGEYLRCAKDPAYFIENYVNYTTWDGVKTLPLMEWQRTVIDKWQYKRGVCGVLPRQSGKTALQVGLMLHSLVFGNERTSIAFLGTKHASAVHVMQQLQLALDRLPEWLKPKTVQRSKTIMEFENGSYVMATSFSSSSLRGRAISDLYIDEVAFISNKAFEEFWTCTYPTLAAGKYSRVMMLSTPNGKNHFHATYLRLKQREEWFAFQVFL